MATALALTGGAVALGLYWWRRRSGEKLSDAPSVGHYPLVGSLWHLEEPLYLSLYERFGNQPIVRVHFGTRCVYVFNRWHPFKEAMLDNAEQLSGRQSQRISASLLGGTGGFGGADGEVWREYRRFTLKTLRDFGFGRRGAEEIISIEAEHVFQAIDEAEGAPVDTTLLMGTATSNIICQLVFGNRLASEDPHFAEILDIFDKILKDGSSNAAQAVMLSLLSVVDRIPFLLPLFKFLPNSMTVVENFKKLNMFCREQRDKKAAEMDKVGHARDYIEAHLLYQGTRPEMFTDNRLARAVSELFLAGTDTTSNTLRWAVLFAIANPEAADKMHNEIVDNIGRERLPTMQDKAALNYTQAFIEEVHRRASLVPLGVIHRVTEDITVSGVALKADTLCTFNVYSIHHDPELFPEPTRFLPERHLKDGQFVPCPYLASFGLGKRACLGESLARMELVMFLTALVQRYSFSLDPEDKRNLWDLMDDPAFSKGCLIRSPPQHKILFKRRV